MKSTTLAIVLFMLIGTSLVGAGAPKIQTADIDAEVVRVRKQLQQIQQEPGSRDVKVQRQRLLIQNEIDRAKAELNELETQKTDTSAKDSKEQKEQKEQAAARRRHAIEALRKYLSILQNMHAQL